MILVLKKFIAWWHICLLPFKGNPGSQINFSDLFLKLFYLFYHKSWMVLYASVLSYLIIATTLWDQWGSYSIPHFIGKEIETLYKLRVYPPIIPLEEVRPQTSLWERPLLPSLYYPLPLASTTIFFACLIFQKILSFRRLSVIHFFELLKTWNIMLKILLIHMDWVYWLSKI